MATINYGNLNLATPDYGFNGVKLSITLLLIFFIPFAIYGIAIFYKRRSIHPIKGRNYWLVMGTVISQALHGITSMVLQGDRCPQLNIQSFFITTAASLYVVRCLALKFKFEAAHERFEHEEHLRAYHKKKTPELQKKFWYTDRQHWVKSKRLITYSVGISVFWIIPAVIVAIGSDCTPSSMKLYMNGFLFFASIVIFSMAVWIRKVVEGFKIKWELKWVCVLCFVLNAIFSIMSRTDAILEWQYNNWALQHYVTIAFHSSTIYLSCYVPAKMTKHDKLELKTKACDTLRDCLVNKEYLILFKEHLKREFSVENILFYEACIRYAEMWVKFEIVEKKVLEKQKKKDAKKRGRSNSRVAKDRSNSRVADDDLSSHALPTEDEEEKYGDYTGQGNDSGLATSHMTESYQQRKKDDCLHMAEYIWNQFADPEALNAVNLPHFEVTRIKEVLFFNDRLDAENAYDTNTDAFKNVFNESKEGIFHLMDTDTFRRFKRSELFSTIEQTIAQDRKLKKAIDDLKLDVNEI